MRRKKHKASRRIVRYYKLHFGFREPYKVLLDGNFLHALAQLKYDNIEGIIGTLLGGKVKLFVPSCAVRELRELAKEDSDFRAAAALARKFVRHKDGCPPSEANTSCLLKQVENGNNQHWWLASQDQDLTGALRKVTKSGVPIIYANINGVHLMPPSETTKATVEDKTQTQMQPGEKDQQLLRALAAPEGAAGVAKKKKKKKKPKAPNPLAVKSASKVQKVAAQPKTRRKRSSGARDDG